MNFNLENPEIRYFPHISHLFAWCQLTRIHTKSWKVSHGILNQAGWCRMNAIFYQAVVFNLQPFKSLVHHLEWGKKHRHDMEKVLQYSTIQVSHLIVQFRMGKLRMPISCLALWHFKLLTILHHFHSMQNWPGETSPKHMALKTGHGHTTNMKHDSVKPWSLAIGRTTNVIWSLGWTLIYFFKFVGIWNLPPPNYVTGVTLL